MPFAFHGTHISGGNFNNVSGNMTQVFNSHAMHVDTRPDQALIDGAQRVLPSRTVNHSFGAIRVPTARQHGFRPYAIANRVHGRQHSDMPGGDMLYGIAPGPPATRDDVPAYTGSMPIEACNLARFQQRIGSGEAPASSAEDISNTFNSVSGDMTQLSVTSYGESGLDILYRDVVREALHDSGERFTEPACHPGTRTAILEQLCAWSIETSPESTIMWLNGSAGAGKSAIAQMFAGDCQEKGRLGASFFFRRRDSKRGTWRGLFPTIAYQLATSIPALYLPMQQAVEKDKLIAGRAMPVQFQRLFRGPFSQALSSLPFLPVIVLDGLDECEDHKIQQQIVGLFIDAAKASQLPMRLLICSRPEPHLREIIEAAETFATCQQYVLRADRSAYGDIRTYLGAEFSRIRSEYMARGTDLGAPWPPATVLDHLVTKSSGIFIYATTVIRFVGDQYSHPADRLDSVLSLDPQSTAPLDDLYTEILSSVPEEHLLRILSAIRLTAGNRLQMDPEEIDMLLGLRLGTTRSRLRGLHSLFAVPPIRPRFAFRREYGFFRAVTVLHASLGDYLTDPRRSGRWCLSVPSLESELLHCTVCLLGSPPPTPLTREFYSELVETLPMALRNTTPSDALVGLLRNEAFQDSLFMSCEFNSVACWPHRDSPYPPDLLQIWEDHRFICDLVSHLDARETPGSPTFKFDAIYAEIFAKHNELLLVLRMYGFSDWNLSLILELCGGTYAIFRPFLQFRQLLDFPLPKGDSPLDFLYDRRRAGELDWNLGHPAEELVVRWISRAKGFIERGEDALTPNFLLSLPDCGTSPRILRELETLNLSALCGQLDEDGHVFVHRDIIHLDTIQLVLDWLWEFPGPPIRVIRFWKQQQRDISRCYNRMAGGRLDVEDGEDSDGVGG
ncbi:hypothetical protein B0H13DRAFT_2653849 [Mycena leptocephala]|nr:hypothetical protein B0H13DRAFT_2653849 [Mycena leptocephala]